jgi:hypothetical protein
VRVALTRCASGARVRAALLAAIAGCADVASSDDGLGDLLVVDDVAMHPAQFRPGAFPAASGGPAVISAQPIHTAVVVGHPREQLGAALDPAATGAIVGVAGARGAWILPTGAPDIETPGDASLHAIYGLDPAFAPGPFTLLVAGVDADGRIGPAQGIEQIALPDAPPTGALVIGLDWQGTADLDLHVIDGDGIEIWIGNPSSYRPPPPGDPVDPCAYASAGILDLDANQDCRRDGAPGEHVVWTPRTCLGMPVSPVIPPGTYTVRVEATSPCADASTGWLVTAFRDGAPIGAARGIATPDDAEYGTHGAGAGVTALTFTWP